MSRLPKTEQTDVLVVRISPTLKQKLFELAKRNKSKYGGSASSAIRYLIESAVKYH
jgi:hypothetical protein